MLPELPELPDPELPELDPELLPDPCRSGAHPELPEELLPLLLPGVSWPGNCAVWHAGRGSLGRQSVGVWPLRLGLLDMEPDDDEPGLELVPWFCVDGL